MVSVPMDDGDNRALRLSLSVYCCIPHRPPPVCVKENKTLVISTDYHYQPLCEEND